MVVVAVVVVVGDVDHLLMNRICTTFLSVFDRDYFYLTILFWKEINLKKKKFCLWVYDFCTLLNGFSTVVNLQKNAITNPEIRKINLVLFFGHHKFTINGKRV